MIKSPLCIVLYCGLLNKNSWWRWGESITTTRRIRFFLPPHTALARWQVKCDLDNFSTRRANIHSFCSKGHPVRFGKDRPLQPTIIPTFSSQCPFKHKHSARHRQIYHPMEERISISTNDALGRVLPRPIPHSRAPLAVKMGREVIRPTAITCRSRAADAERYRPDPLGQTISAKRDVREPT